MAEGKPVLLDLYCKQGGAARGYQEAGFHVVGVDIEPQPNYCGDEFYQRDALRVLAGDWPETGGADVSAGAFEDYAAERAALRVRRFAAIHASPPCQNRSVLKSRWKGREYPELIARTRELLIATGLPYVIENVEGARGALIEPTMLCGASFNLGVRRHRLFETTFPLFAPACAHPLQPHPVPVYGHTGSGANRGRERELGRANTAEEWREAMGIHWMTADGLAQAIPPAYTRYIGYFLRAHIQPATALERAA